MTLNASCASFMTGRLIESRKTRPIMVKKNNVPITVRIDVDLAEAVRVEAERQHRSVSNLVELILMEWVRRVAGK